MFSGAVSAFIQAPPEAVFAYIADIGRHGEWGAQRKDVAPEPGGSHMPPLRPAFTLAPWRCPARFA